jgi:hypothetical protein
MQYLCRALQTLAGTRNPGFGALCARNRSNGRKICVHLVGPVMPNGNITDLTAAIETPFPVTLGPRPDVTERGIQGSSEGAPSYSSQSRSFSFRGRYSSVTKLIPRRESASSSNLSPLLTISWISRCQCAFLNQG